VRAAVADEDVAAQGGGAAGEDALDDPVLTGAPGRRQPGRAAR